MARILIVRHGETEWNAEGRIQGHTDISLSDKGRQQAWIVARRLADTPIDVAYCSDLRRTSETARIILGERDIQLHLTPQLREYHKGVFEGLTAAEMQSRYPEMYAASLVRDLDFAPTGGESMRQASVRMADFVRKTRERHRDGTMLIVGHGGSLRCAIVALLGLPLEATWRFVMGNCSLSIIDTYPDNAVLRLYNDTSHLVPPSPIERRG
jgi:probable phosphoglycerate mutase